MKSVFRDGYVYFIQWDMIPRYKEMLNCKLRYIHTVLHYVQYLLFYAI